MKSLIKQTIRIGNSSGVLLPKSWESKKVRVELVQDSITEEVFNKLRKKELLEDVMGIYLVGSYARGEESTESDIDILVITGKTNLVIEEGDYEILLISKDKLENNLSKSLYLSSMIIEAKTLFNKELLYNLQKENNSLNIRKKIEEIKKILEVNKESIQISDEHNENLSDGVAYSLILRLRELYLISCISNSKRYTNKEFLNLTNKEGFQELYDSYVRIKKNQKPRNKSKAKDAKNLISLALKLIKDINNGKKRKKS